MRRFYIDRDLVLGTVAISGAEAYHMRTVLRLNTGDSCLLVNGRSQRALARVAAVDKEALTLEIEELLPDVAPKLELLVLQGFLKERKLDELIRPLSELGVTGFGAVFTERSIPAPDAKRLSGRLERWNKLAVEALKQCRSGALMQIRDTWAFSEAVAAVKDYDVKLFVWEGAEAGLKHTLSSYLDAKAPIKKAVILLGPEGGFSLREAALAQAHGFMPVSLGARILRSQTAAVATAAIVQYMLGDFGAAGIPD